MPMEKFDSNPKTKTALVSNGAKPPASISLDLDNLWSYLKTHGTSGPI
jgi:hypothetical protein